MRAFNYRMNRATYGANLALLVVGYVILANLVERPPGAEAIVAFIAVPRLHDIGRSGLWFLLLVAGEIIAVAIGWPLGVDGILIAGGIYVIICLVLLTVLAFIPGQDGPNRWGDAPPTGVHLGRLKSSADAK